MAGTLIAIEGTDGSGKGTQVGLLLARLEKLGIMAKSYDFPRYDEPSAYFIQQYLRGAYPESATGPYQASLFYAMDRYEASIDLRQDLADGFTVIANRYTTSNLAHQGGKIVDKAERERFYDWAAELENDNLKIPKPEKVIILHVPAETGQALAEKKHPHMDLAGLKADIHEGDLSHLMNAEKAYLELSGMDHRLYSLIECADNEGKMLSREAIHELIWAEIQKIIVG